MIDEFSKSMKAVLYERTASPLSGALAVSWIIWNYRLIAVLLSDLAVQERFSYIDKVLYAEPSIALLKLCVGPVLTTIIVIFVYPFPAKWVFKFWRSRQRELREIRQQIDDLTPLTREQARQIRQQVISIQIDYDKQLERASDEESRLKQMVTSEQKRASELERKLVEQVSAAPTTNNRRATAEEIGAALRRHAYQLKYYSSAGKLKTRVLLFGPNGTIVEGRSDAESSWRVSEGMLETLRSDGRVHARFAFFPVSNVFIHTNDSDTLSSKGQFLVPMSESESRADP